MADKKFIDGLFIDVKSTQYGEIIKLSFNVEKFKPFINENQNEKGYVNVDILTNREGKKYAVLNEYVKKEVQPAQNKQTQELQVEDDLPF